MSVGVGWVGVRFSRVGFVLDVLGIVRVIFSIT